MNPADEGLGLPWIAIGAIGFAVGFILAKMKIVHDGNVAPFCSWSSGLFAAVVALAADTSPGIAANVFGRLGIFAIVWIAIGCVFTVGVLMGVEKSQK